MAETSGSGSQPNLRSRWTGFPRPGVLLLFTLVLAAVVRCTTLSFQSLWLDEISIVIEAGRPWSELLPALFSPYQAYPLYVLGMRVWITLFGSGDAAVRWPSAIAGLSAVPLLWLLGRRLFGRTVGLLAAILLAISPLAAWYSQEATAYAILMGLTLAAWLLLWQAVEGRARWAWWGFGAVTIIALFVHRLAILSVPGQLLFLLYAARQGRFAQRHRRLLTGLLVGILIISAAGYWIAVRQTGASRQFAAEPLRYALADTFTQLSLRVHPGVPEPGQGPDRRPWLLAFGLAALAGGLALLGDIRAGGRRQRRAIFFLCFLLVPAGLFFLLLGRIYIVRYLLFILPPYLLLLAVGGVGLWKWAFRWARTHRDPLYIVPALLALVSVLVPLALSWRQVQDWTFSRLPQKEQFREATLYLQQHLHPGDLVVVQPGYLQPDLQFYQVRFPRVPLDFATLPDMLTEGYTFREFDTNDMGQLSRGRRRAWLVLAPYHAPIVDPKNWAYEWFNFNPFLHCEDRVEPRSCDQVKDCRSVDCGVRFHGLTLYCVTFNEDRRVGFPSPTISLEASFGAQILLWGADLQPFQQPLQPGDLLPLTLYARGLRTDLPDLEAVVRLTGEDGQMWAEEARRPLGGGLPTTCWLPDDDFLDFHELLLPGEMPAGRYRVQVGYRLAGQPDEMLLLSDGSTWADLGEVEVAALGGAP